MAAVRSRGNKDTELKLVAIMRAYDINGWRRHQSVHGKPDFVFARERLALFVDGCFWHGCRWHLRIPQSNRKYWVRKIADNVARDRSTNLALRKAGWKVLRVWEHSLLEPATVAQRLISKLSAARKQYIDAAGMYERPT